MILQPVAAPYPSSSMDYHLFDAIKNEIVIVMTNLSNILEYRVIVVDSLETTHQIPVRSNFRIRT